MRLVDRHQGCVQGGLLVLKLIYESSLLRIDVVFVRLEVVFELRLEFVFELRKLECQIKVVGFQDAAS